MELILLQGKPRTPTLPLKFVRSPCFHFFTRRLSPPTSLQAFKEVVDSLLGSWVLRMTLRNERFNLP